MRQLTKFAVLSVIIIVIALSVAIDGSEKVVARAISLNSVFTGLLTLTGFLFSARTFITFKLNDSVYSKENYRTLIKGLAKEGAYDGGLYAPLKILDGKLGATCRYCFIVLFLVISYSFLPKDWQSGPPLWDLFRSPAASIPLAGASVTWRFAVHQLATVLVFSAIFAIIIEIFCAITAVNRNIQAIIANWESEQEAVTESSTASPKQEQTKTGPVVGQSK